MSSLIPSVLEAPRSRAATRFTACYICDRYTAAQNAYLNVKFTGPVPGAAAAAGAGPAKAAATAGL